jgi:hypothetical protein
LFEATPAEEELDFPGFRRWLVPCTALFAALFTFHAQSSRPGFQWVSSPATGFVAAVQIAQPEMASYASLDHSDHNLIPMTSAAFDWTNGSLSLTTAIPVMGKNSLIQ